MNPEESILSAFTDMDSSGIKRRRTRAVAHNSAQPRQRRPHAERSAETKAKLVQAAIKCLHRYGYSAASTTMVSDEAGVSRGAMTHQFPSKVDLMLAVVRSVFEGELAEYERLLGSRSPKDSFFAFPAIAWGVLSRPAAIAVTEIMMASRSDPALAAGLAPMQSSIERDAGRGVLHTLRDAGLSDRKDGIAIHRLFVAALRGLAIERLFSRDKSEIEDAVAVLEKVLHLLYPASANTSTSKKRPRN
jgi:AcrR family transcriptional regulator